MDTFDESANHAVTSVLHQGFQVGCVDGEWRVSHAIRPSARPMSWSVVDGEHCNPYFMYCRTSHIFHVHMPKKTSLPSFHEVVEHSTFASTHGCSLQRPCCIQLLHDFLTILSSHCTPTHSSRKLTRPGSPQLLVHVPRMIVPHSIPSSKSIASSFSSS
jgi:hypothetical protein